LPSPVHIGISIYSFESRGSTPGNIPIVVPPFFFAPLQTDSMTPPWPPQTIVTLAVASKLPTFSASVAFSGDVVLSPITAMIKCHLIGNAIDGTYCELAMTSINS